MRQFLPRGYLIDDQNRITKMLSDGGDWQIYLTNRGSYVLAAKLALYSKWVSDYDLPASIFRDSDIGDYKIYASTSHYIVSSIEKGPFPENNGQIEAFSIAFRTARDLYPDADVHNALYIEEFSLILPVSAETNLMDNGVVYGKWLTGGVNISIASIERVSKIMSWLPEDTLRKSAALAGFDIPDTPAIEADEHCGETETIADTRDAETVPQIPGEAFTLVGRPELEQFINDNIIDIVLHQEQYKRMGISFPGATILYGPPGCGKTFAVEKLTEYLGWKRFDIDSSTIASSYIHDTSKKISEVFQAAIKAAPSILVIDEMEAFLTDRSMAGPSGTHHIEEVAEFLRRIPEAISKGVLVFAMTNMIDSIDPAILRRGRFDHIVEVKMATAKEIESLLLSKFKELPIDEDVHPAYIAQALDGHPMSDITFVLREAGRFAVKRNADKIDAACFENALNLLPKKKEKAKIGFVND